MGQPEDSGPKNNSTDPDMILAGMNALDLGVGLFDRDWHLCHFTPQLENNLGSFAGFVHSGMTFQELLDYDETPSSVAQKTIGECLNLALKYLGFNKVIDHSNGRILRIKGTPLEYRGYMLSCEDITDIESQNRTLQTREEAFRTYMELSPIGALLVEMDGSIRFHNNRILEIFGYSENELSDLKTSELYFDQHDRRQFIETLLERKAPTNFRFLGRKKDGSAFPLLLTSSIVTLKGEQQIFTWVNDLTDLVDAERTIERLNEQNRMILTAAGAGIFGIDEKSHIQFINPAAEELLEYDAEELIGKHFEVLLTEQEELGELTSVHSFKGETEMVKKSGRTFPVKYTLSKLDHQQDVGGRVIVFDDVSDRLAAEEVLRQAMTDIEASSQAKSQFLSTMSHELRTPLNAILGFTQILKNNQLETLNTQQLTFIDHIFSAGEHLLKLINEAIDLASIESGKVSFSKQTIDARDITDASLFQLKEMADIKQIKVNNTVPEDGSLLFQGDYARLQQVLMHLISNAIKYNHENGLVKITGEPADDDHIRITVIDTGPGIPQEESEDIFAPFNRLKAHSLGIEGTGLGLTLSKNLTILMGGKIGYFANSDIGSSFWIELPRAEKDAPLLLHETPPPLK